MSSCDVIYKPGDWVSYESKEDILIYHVLQDGRYGGFRCQLFYFSLVDDFKYIFLPEATYNLNRESYPELRLATDEEILMCLAHL